MPRKERKRRLEKKALADTAKQCKTLHSFFSVESSVPSTSSTCTSIPETDSGQPSSQPDELRELEEDDLVEVTGNASTIDDTYSDVWNGEQTDETESDSGSGIAPETGSSIDQESTVIYRDVGDLAYGRVQLANLTPVEKIKYIEDHFTPDSHYQHFHRELIPKGQHSAPKTLTFQPSWLLQYDWLVYSQAEHGGFCKFCVVFPPVDSKLLNNVLIGRPFKSFRKAKGKDDVLSLHGQLAYHKIAVLKYKDLKQSVLNPAQHVDAMLDRKKKELYEKNLHCLKGIIECVIFCGKQNIALRGHRDDSTSSSSNKGNFLALLELLASRDQILRDHLENGSRTSRYTSKTIQNEVIELIGSYVRSKVTRDLTGQTSSKYFSILADEVTDSSTNKEVLSVCLRFLSGKGAEVNITESFVDFVKLERTTGKAIADSILKSLYENGFDFQNLRGQGYDGASAMSSSVKGVNGRIREVAPLALYSHCKSHALNLSIAACCKLPSIRNMVGSLNEVYLFFLNSPKRQSFFESILTASESTSTKTKIQGLCKTRWVERHDCYETFHELLGTVVISLEAMLRPAEFDNLVREDWSWDPETRTKAQGLLSTLQSFKFVITFLVTKRCLTPIRPVAVKLQKSSMDTFAAYQIADNTIQDVTNMRDNIEKDFVGWYQEAKQQVENIGGQVSKPRTNTRQVHRNNAPSDSAEDYYRKNLAIPLLDHLITELTTRFDPESRTCASLFQLIPKLLFKVDNLGSLSEKLLFWKDDLPTPLSLLSELEFWKNYWTGKDMSPCNLIECLRQCDRDVFPNIHELLCVACVTPVGSTEAERSFSGLRRIKSYLRNRMSVGRLTGLALMHMHHETEIQVEEVASLFIQKHNRRLFQGNIFYT